MRAHGAAICGETPDSSARRSICSPGCRRYSRAADTPVCRTTSATTDSRRSISSETMSWPACRGMAFTRSLRRVRCATPAAEAAAGRVGTDAQPRTDLSPARPRLPVRPHRCEHQSPGQIRHTCHRRTVPPRASPWRRQFLNPLGDILHLKKQDLTSRSHPLAGHGGLRPTTARPPRGLPVRRPAVPSTTRRRPPAAGSLTSRTERHPYTDNYALAAVTASRQRRPANLQDAEPTVPPPPVGCVSGAVREAGHHGHRDGEGEVEVHFQLEPATKDGPSVSPAAALQASQQWAGRVSACSPYAARRTALHRRDAPRVPRRPAGCPRWRGRRPSSERPLRRRLRPEAESAGGHATRRCPPDH
jgi:hypothetical protein